MISWGGGIGPSYDSSGRIRIYHSPGFTDELINVSELEQMVDGEEGLIYEFEEESLGNRRHIASYNKADKEWLVYVRHFQGYSLFVCSDLN